MYTLKDEDDESGYLAKTLWYTFIIFLVVNFFPGSLPFETFSFWYSKGDIYTWLNIATPLFIWGGSVTLLLILWSFYKGRMNERTNIGITGGFLVSLWAGIVEEICFRWILFLGGIIGAKVFNFLFFGFLGFGVPQWLQINFFGPIANFFTLGYLSEYLTSPENWAIGAGMLSANALFRDGHKYQGPFGILNSWFAGMFLFWVLFTYGLWPCIIIHFTYDLIVFTLVAVAHNINGTD